MDIATSGGLGAVSFGISSTLVGVVVLLVVLFGLWKLAKIVWAIFSN
jgi:phage shock protein PspC (stress-responsive transcriptional regulator)